MQFSAAEWWAMGIAVTITIAVIGYFLKKTMERVDTHDKDINVIKQTYVTKDEFKELRAEIKEDLDKLSQHVDALKDLSLPKQDFFRAQSETNENIKSIYNMLLQMQRSGGERHE